MPQVFGAAEDRDRAGVAARQQDARRALPEHDIADSLLREWREQFLAAGAEPPQGKSERTEADELRARVGKLERALDRSRVHTSMR